MNAKETVDSVTSLHGDALPSKPRWIQTDAGTANALSERVFKTLVLVVCGWSLIEAPLELGMSDAHAGLFALLLSKLVVVGTGLAAVAKARFARETFAFLCGASVLAIAPALPTEFNRSFAMAIFSTVECLSKAACVMAFGIASSREKQSRQP
ncbi:hypothetical protein [Caballeronia mineralivorans]|uniref:hypothetical protein n=1 Tax=Caballeronia mineralivorans TaxID=2010198 RepID=UPI0023F2EED6|nr:hypothetical protein [Caballeronia mineralivorans]MDB5789364.1 hypothetical protein [Caballeronia mineralivorans]